MLWFAFNAMGEFAFDEPFGMLKSGTWHRAVVQQRSALGLLGSLGHTVWMNRLAFALGSRFWRVKDWMAMVSFSDKQIERRLSRQRARAQNENQAPALNPSPSPSPSSVDVAAYFIAEYEIGRTAENERAKWRVLSGNTISVIVGGREV
ncbi:hypothetical protein BDW62DRAFT_178939 [Aspergillus aurantiobrunneus]